MAVKVSRKGDLIELGAGAAYRLEQAVLVAADGSEARHPTLAASAGDDDADGPPRPWKLYRRVENEMGEDDNGNATRLGADGKPTTYEYRYDAMAEFMADDEAAAIDQAQSLIEKEG